jgi:hypothetical protein
VHTINKICPRIKDEKIKITRKVLDGPKSPSDHFEKYFSLLHEAF